ncbi:MAG: hypothetical protein K8R60_14490 [Burkholderiales bacterium]|nr:hypothetical protein [Burkholderiales bacterium]
MNISLQARRALLLASLLALSLASARAAEPPKPTIAVLSLIGDELTLVTRRMSTGSQLDRNDRQAIPIANPAFDVAAAVAAERAIKQALPSAERIRVSVRDQRLFSLQDRVLEPGPASDGMREALQALLLKEKATHLMLVTKRRDNAQFRMIDSYTGDGKVSGMGIYIDNTKDLQSETTGQSGTGYFACYAYVKVTLVDVATMRSLGARNGTESVMTTPIGRNDASTAWDALSAQGKEDNLVRVAEQAVFRATLEVAAVL